MSILRRVRRFVEKGSACALCGARDTSTIPYLCPECERDLLKDAHPVKVSESDLSGWACGIYGGGMKELILRYKHGEETYLAATLAHALMAVGMEKGLFEKRTLVRIPMTTRERARRGHDPMGAIFEEMRDTLGRAMEELRLEKTRHTRPQSSLGEVERRKNLLGAFCVPPTEKISPRVLIIDDVLTTGSTLRECEKVLRQSGVKDICFLTLAD